MSGVTGMIVAELGFKPRSGWPHTPSCSTPKFHISHLIPLQPGQVIYTYISRKLEFSHQQNKDKNHSFTGML